MARERHEEEEEFEVESESGLDWVMAALVVIVVVGFFTI